MNMRITDRVLRRTHATWPIAWFSAGALIMLAACDPSNATRDLPEAPYPQSAVLSVVAWDTANLVRLAPGSDLWPIAWAADDNLYTSWGDGGGFGGTNSEGRVSMGIGRITAGPAPLVTENVLGGVSAMTPLMFEGKSDGLIAVDSMLYLNVSEQDGWLRSMMYESQDFGVSWTANEGGWFFDQPDGVFGNVSFLTVGRANEGAQDDYVYGYCESERQVEPLQSGIDLFRVNKRYIMDRDSVEFFTGVDGAGTPQWTPDITDRRPVFTDSNGVGWGVQVAYSPPTQRYLLTVRHDSTGGWGIFDAPTPWGPWTTVAYYDRWLDDEFKFTFVFNQKWMDPDGTSMWMVFSGTGEYDSFNLVEARISVKRPGS